MAWDVSDLYAAVTMLEERQPALLTHFGLDAAAAEAIARQALDCTGTGELFPYALDVFAWRAADNAAAFGFNFSADGGSYQLAELAEQVKSKRVAAEYEAARRGVPGFEWPAVEVTASEESEWQS